VNYPNQQVPQPGFALGYGQTPFNPAQQYAQVPQTQFQPPVSSPSQPLARGTLDDFYGQPAGGGGVSVASFFKDKTTGMLKPVGTRLDAMIARNVTDADIRQQTDLQNNPKTYKDGRPMFVMVIPLAVTPSPDFPEGEASWWVKGRTRDELTRAMGEAGVSGAPQAGALVSITLAGTRPIKNMQPEVLYGVNYTPPQGTQVAAPAPEPAQPAFQAPAAVTVVPAAQAPVAPAPVATGGISAEQQALLAQLQGRQG